MERNQKTSITNKYTSLSDDELRHKISEISKQFPNSGCLEIIRHLKNLEQPILLQRDRCLKHLSDVEPVRTARRWSQAIHRRQYNVSCPNALCLIDSNYAIISWVISWILDLSRLDSYIFLLFLQNK